RARRKARLARRRDERQLDDGRHLRSSIGDEERRTRGDSAVLTVSPQRSESPQRQQGPVGDRTRAGAALLYVRFRAGEEDSMRRLPVWLRRRRALKGER